MKDTNLKHLCLQWGELDDRCRKCKTPTVLVTVAHWRTHPADKGQADDFVEPLGEVAGHYCPECDRLVAIFLNDL